MHKPPANFAAPWLPSARWVPQEWRSYTLTQQPPYPDILALDRVTRCLKKLPPLVEKAAIETLKQRLRKIFVRGGLIVQAGDCVEMFAQINAVNLAKTVQLFAQLARGCREGLGIPPLIMGRLAGQFAKPRSCMSEVIAGIELPSFQGEIINGVEVNERIPCPQRMCQAYNRSRFILNTLKSFANPLVRLGDNFFTTHEAYLLPFEEGLCRLDDQSNRWYSTSAHSLWVGNRTMGRETAHIHFIKGIANPISLKVGPDLTPQQLREILTLLECAGRPGEILLLLRLGLEKIESALPPILQAIGHLPVLWLVDPMHGNTIRVGAYKTRLFATIEQELQLFYKIMQAHGLQPHGIHCEVTAEEVTECLDPARGINDIGQHYTTGCDPRLNPEQFLDIIQTCCALWKRS